MASEIVKVVFQRLVRMIQGKEAESLLVCIVLWYLLVLDIFVHKVLRKSDYCRM
jgi:hypothetical protein